MPLPTNGLSSPLPPAQAHVQEQGAGPLDVATGAPIRRPLDWRNPAFYDRAALNVELERVFDICHTCRRCVSLCGAFPTLFDLIDESKTGELDSVDKADFGKVVDPCYLCDVCFMTKCPYVPPRPWNVDFPHLMLRAKDGLLRKEFPKAPAHCTRAVSIR